MLCTINLLLFITAKRRKQPNVQQLTNTRNVKHKGIHDQRKDEVPTHWASLWVQRQRIRLSMQL